MSAIHLRGRSGKGRCRNLSGNLLEISQTFRRTSALFPDAHFPRNFRQVFARALSLIAPQVGC